MIALNAESCRDAVGGALKDCHEGAAAMARSDQAKRKMLVREFADFSGTVLKIVQLMWNPARANDWLEQPGID